jgi:hypothetical protein
MFDNTKERIKNIKNASKETFSEMKKLKDIQDLDSEIVKRVVLLLVTGLGIGYLASLLPAWLYGIFVGVVILLYLVAVKYDRR